MLHIAVFNFCFLFDSVDDNNDDDKDDNGNDIDDHDNNGNKMTVAPVGGSGITRSLIVSLSTM